MAEIIVVGEPTQTISVVNGAGETVEITGSVSTVISPEAIAAVVSDYLDEHPITSGYVHVQIIALATWVINHPLGRRPNVALFTTDGEEVEADIIASNTVVTITLPGPMAGQAILT